MRVIGLAALAILSGTTSAKKVERKKTNSLQKSGVDSSLAALRAGFEQLDIKRHLQDDRKKDDEECDLGTIVDVAVGNGSFGTLVAAVTAADLVETLSGDGPFTVFAPTDDAFAALPEGTVEGLLEDIPTLTSILTYHVVAGKVESTDLVNGPVTTVNGADVEINLDDGVKVNDSNVIIPDVQACNGVIHVIDAVLLPPTPEAAPEPEDCDLGTIVDVAVGNGSFETLVAAVTAADLVETLSGDGPFTVFAPTDDAFAALPEGTVEGLLEDIPTLTSILTYHVVAGKVESTDLVNGPVTTVNGADVEINLDDGVKVNDSNVIIPDVQACNGVIHVIDAVLLPPTPEAAPEEDRLCSFCPGGVDDPAAVLPVPGGETCEQASTFAAGLAASDPQCTVVLLAENTCCPPKTIVEIAAGNEDFSTLVAAVTAAGLVDTLSGDGPFTVFAPTNEAFAALPEGTVDSLLLPENVDQLTSILTYHVVATDLPSDAINTGSVPTVNGAEVDVVVSDDGITVNGANVVIPDVKASNGIIHAIDAVLLPPTPEAAPACPSEDGTGTIVDVAVGNGSFGTLVAAVTAADLVETLQSPGPFTVFVKCSPTDDAFAALPAGTVESLLLPENKDQLVSILTYHVVAGKVESTDLVNGPVTTVNGADVEINLDDGVKVNDSNVIIPDVQACNGVIHVIDAVLLPPMDDGGDDGGDAEISEPDKPSSGDMFSKSGKSKSAKSCSTKSGKSTKSCTKTLKEKQAKVAKALNEVVLPDAKAEKISKSSKGCDYVGKSGKSGTDSGKSGRSGTDSGKSGKSCSKSVKAASKMAGPKGSGMPATKPEESACDLGTIVDVAIANGSFNTLVAAVTAAELAGTLSSDGPFTVFAPTDDAFAALPEGTVEGLLEDIPALTSILTYHVVAGKVESTDLVNGPVTTVNGADVEINLDDGVKVNDSNVIIADVQACNGVIHVIDAVLIPPEEEAAPEEEATRRLRSSA